MSADQFRVTILKDQDSPIPTSITYVPEYGEEPPRNDRRPLLASNPDNVRCDLCAHTVAPEREFCPECGGEL